MPYHDVHDLPESVREHLPVHAQDVYLAAYNSAWDEYKRPDRRRGEESREETAHKVAWAAVKHEYEKDERTGEWKPKLGEYHG
jgi:cation transport regulator